LLSYLEYYHVTLDGIPYREIDRGGILGMPHYLVFAVVPVIALITLLPLFDRWASHRFDRVQLNREFVVTMANFLWALTLNNALFYGFRFAAPLSTDPLAGHWITMGEAPFSGLVNLFGMLMPTWYFVTIPISIAVYLASYIS
jgi:hypothetical protein